MSWVPVGQGWGAKSGRELGSPLCPKQPHSVITGAEACWCFFPLRVLNPNDKIGTEGGRDGVGIYRGLETGRDTARVEGHRQDSIVEKGNGRSSGR